MKAQLVYELPQESEEYKLAVNGGKYHAALTDILELLRRKHKYEELENVNLQDLRTEIYGILSSRDIEI
jgi:hypothetical protein